MSDTPLSKKTWSYLTIIAFLLGSGGGIGSGLVYFKSNPEIVRYDPFTGSDGDELMRRIILLEARELPPIWLIKEVEHLHKEVKDNTKSIRKLESSK